MMLLTKIYMNPGVKIFLPNGETEAYTSEQVSTVSVTGGDHLIVRLNAGKELHFYRVPFAIA
jgi:hypothetical protein